MKLYAQCQSCKKSIEVKSRASTRPNLQMEKGDEFNLNCQNCGSNQKTHVNDVNAEADTKILLIGAGVGLVVTAVLWQFYGAIGTISMTIPVLFWRQQSSKTHAFNSYMIRRKR